MVALYNRQICYDGHKWMEEGLMRNLLINVTIIAVLLTAGLAQAGVCEIVNRSFEDDGLINDVTQQEPNGWDVNVPSDKFTISTNTSWSTDGRFSLFVSSQWYRPFTAGDEASVSQQINLTDIIEIKFDLKLDTYSGIWDPNLIIAIVLIDDDVVWEPNSASPDIRGEYIGQSYAVEDKYRDDELHTLSFGLRVNVNAESGFPEFYRVWWDSIDCCNSESLLVGDLNRDCYVDVEDLILTADVWLNEVDPNDEINMFKEDDWAGYGIINFYDFAIFADYWLDSSYQQEEQVLP
jgi:hypothetical protein